MSPNDQTGGKSGSQSNPSRAADVESGITGSRPGTMGTSTGTTGSGGQSQSGGQGGSRTSGKPDRNRLKEKWNRFTDNDLARIERNADDGVHVLQERYGRTQEEAAREWREFTNEGKGQAGAGADQRSQQGSQQRTQPGSQPGSQQGNRPSSGQGQGQGQSGAGRSGSANAGAGSDTDEAAEGGTER